MPRTKVMSAKAVIQIGELRESALFSDEFYDRLLAFIAAHPHSLARLFEIGAVSAMAAFSGDTFALQSVEATLPARQASQRGRRKSRAPRAKARKQS